jgi:hypothetical protein
MTGIGPHHIYAATKPVRIDARVQLVLRPRIRREAVDAKNREMASDAQANVVATVRTDTHTAPLPVPPKGPSGSIRPRRVVVADLRHRLGQQFPARPVLVGLGRLAAGRLHLASRAPTPSSSLSRRSPGRTRTVAVSMRRGDGLLDATGSWRSACG